MTYSSKIIIFIFTLVPVLLLTGPALPDIAVTISVLYFLIVFLFFKKDFQFTKNLYFITSIIFWISIIFISFFAIDKYKSFQDSIIFLRLLMIPIICIYFFYDTQKKILNSINLIFIIVVFVLIDTLFQYFNYSSEFGFGRDLLGFKSDWYGRLTGPFGDELIPGAYVSKFGLLGYLFFIFRKNFKYKNILEVLYLTLICFVTFASGERMALATFLLALFFLLVFLKNKRLIFLFSILFSFILIFTSLKFHPFYNDYRIIESTHFHQGLKIEKNFDCDLNISKKCTKIINLQPSFIKILENFKSSAYGEIYQAGLKMFINNPITGIGISNYETVCNNKNIYKNLMKNYSCASHPHNYYIQWLSEGGIITLSAFILLLISIFYLINKNVNIIIKFISLASILILFWPIMSTGSLVKNWNGILTFYIIGLHLSLNNIKIIYRN